jgi:RHH-type rel operon transcriptional repressor/antitoxin RelB
VLVIRLPPHLEKHLDALAKKTGRTKSFYVRQVLEDNIDELEKVYGCHQVKTPDKPQRLRKLTPNSTT